MRLNQRKPAGYMLLMFAAVLALFFCAVSPAWAVPREIVPQDNKIYDWKPLQKNNFFHAITNYGQLGQVKGGSGAYGYWPAPAIDVDGDLVPPIMNYIYGWGLWIGAQTKSTKAGKTRDTLCTQGYNPNNATGEYTAGAVIDGIPQSVTASDVKIFSSLEEGWPLQASDGKDSVISVEDTRSKYNDYGLINHATGGRPLKVEVTQTTYQWNYPTNQDIIFFLFEVKNTSTDLKDTLFDVYLAPTADCDIGSESGTAANDVCFFDSTTNMSYQYQVSTREAGWSRQPGCVGFMFLESPKATKDYTFPDGYQIYKDSTIGLFAFKNFNIAIDPPDDIAQYKELAGYNYTTSEFKRLDPKPSPGDCRFMESTGPIDMIPGATAKTIVAVICANFDYAYLNVNDTLAIADLRAKAKTAKLIYDANWLLPGPPPAPVLAITPGDRRVIIGWDNSSEIDSTRNRNLLYAQKVTRDSTTLAKFDPNFLINILQGYKLYKSENGADWTLLKQWDKDDRYIVGSVGLIITGPETLKTAATVTTVPPLYRSAVANPVWIKAESTLSWTDPSFTTDTRGSNSGLQYSYVDENLINGFTYYYSVRAYGINWQSKLNGATDSIISKTHAYYETSNSDNVTPAVPRSEPNEYMAPQYLITDYAGKAYRYSQNISITLDLPRAILNETFKQIWGPVTRSANKDISGTSYMPVMSFFVINQAGDTVVPFTKSTAIFDTSRNVTRWMKSIKYTPGNHITIINDIFVNKSGFAAKAIITPGYTDTAYAKVCTGNPATGVVPEMLWTFRSGIFEIRWFNHNPDNPASLSSPDTLWPQVWHVVDSAKNIVVKVPYDSVKMDDWVNSSWNLGGTATGMGRRYIVNLSNLYRKYINVCGMRIFFNNPYGLVVAGKDMVWANKPDSGDVWYLRAAGSTVPVEGEYQTIVTKKYEFTTAVVDLSKIQAVPNPYIARNIWELTNDRNRLQFINLPTKCTVKIYTLAGNLIKVLEHNDNAGVNGGTCWWDPMMTMNQQMIASGVYLYYVDAPGIGTHVGKFAVIR